MPTVIKLGEQNPAVATRLESVNVGDHVTEARLLLERSREKSRRILEGTKVRADALRKQASEEGFKAGFQRGYEAGLEAGRKAAFEKAQQEFTQRQESLIQALQDVLTKFEAQKRDILISARQDVVAFAAKLAQRVTKRAVELDAHSAAANLEAALGLVESRSDVTVIVHPDDHGSLSDFASRLSSDIHEAANVELVTDQDITPGGCIVRTRDTEIDATIDSQIAQIIRLMLPETRENA